MKTIRQLVARVLTKADLNKTPAEMVQIEDDLRGFDAKRQKHVIQALLIWIDEFEQANPTLFTEPEEPKSTHEEVAQEAEEPTAAPVVVSKSEQRRKAILEAEK